MTGWTQTLDEEQPSNVDCSAGIVALLWIACFLVRDSKQAPLSPCGIQKSRRGSIQDKLNEMGIVWYNKVGLLELHTNKNRWIFFRFELNWSRSEEEISQRWLAWGSNGCTVLGKAASDLIIQINISNPRGPNWSYRYSQSCAIKKAVPECARCTSKSAPADSYIDHQFWIKLILFKLHSVRV